MLKTYLKRIFEVARKGDAREESFYQVLQELLKNFAHSTNRTKISITTLPKKTEAGNPDFRVWDGQQSIVGYIEAKKPTEKNLDSIEETDQIKRYLNTFPNLILTNFLEFRLYRNGQKIDSVSIARPFAFVIYQARTIPPVENEESFYNLLNKFFSFSLPKTYTAKSLALELAKRTRFLKEEVVAEELKEETEKKEGFLLGFYEAFQQYLITGLNKDDFADLYSQTITYGLFAARTRCKNGFNRKLAYTYIPETIGILRDLFQFVSLGNLPPAMEWIIDDISEVLATADIEKILHNLPQQGKSVDPIIHFYETFLTEYDPEERERRGVYYTPLPVVSYIVHSLNVILKEKFQKEAGFASAGVTLLDPACGTGTFLAESIKSAVDDFVAKYGKGAQNDFISDHILRNFYGFELMMAPYAVGHLKISFLLKELGYNLQRDERFKLYLTNTLEMGELSETSLPGMISLAKESHLANEVKKQTPILVVLGNPPYSGHSSNIGEWISREIKAYYQVDGKSLNEKNPKWLQDDYVKFIRFSQWKIDKAGEGILGFITNHSYLDNPTFRGMRQSLMKSFDEIYILDLHGNSLKKEKCPDGSKDENVFDIQQGVAIALFIKKSAQPVAKVYYSELYGLREDKYSWLLDHNIKNTDWHQLQPRSEFYFFVPRDEKLAEEYQRFMKVTDIFPLHGVGMTTARDNFVIDRDKNGLVNRIRLFKNSKYSDEELHTFFQIRKKKGWSIRKAWNMLQKIPDEDLEKEVLPVLYRPFDIQWIFYHDAIVWRTVKRVMRHMMRENLGLISVRQVAEGIFNHAFVTTCIVESRITLSNKGIGFVFPLYLYPESEDEQTRIHPETERQSNLNLDVVRFLTEKYGVKPSPEEIFYYIYAVLYSNTYRTRYAEFLKIDFPRVPFPDDYQSFLNLNKLGKRLVDLHLLKSEEPGNSCVKFQGTGENRVEKIEYKEDESRVYINKAQYFEGIKEEVWHYQIGGYQVLSYWLKSRKSRTLSLEEIILYCKIAASIKSTIAIQKEIDKVYQEAEMR